MAVRLIGEILGEMEWCGYSGIAGGGPADRGPHRESQWTRTGAGGTRRPDEEEISP